MTFQLMLSIDGYVSTKVGSNLTPIDIKYFEMKYENSIEVKDNVKLKKSRTVKKSITNSNEINNSETTFSSIPSDIPSSNISNNNFQINI